MRILYCHDNIYQQCPNGIVYSPGQFPYSYWDTFLRHFSHLVIAGRGVPVNQPIEKLNISSGNDVSFVLFPNINDPWGRLKYGRSVNKRLKEVVAECDGVIIRAVSDIGWLVYKHAKAMKKPIAMEMAACAWDSTWNHGNKLGKIYAPIRYLHDRKIAHNADFVIYVSQSFLQNRYPTNGQTAHASNVRIEQASEGILAKRIERLKNKEDTNPTPYVIGLIGNLDNRIKGVEDAIKALRLVEEQKPGSVIFKHLGPGDPTPYRKLAENLNISHLVEFNGMIQSGEKILNWLDIIDLYLQPSYQEGVPRATIEAMSRGCPVIGSTVGGLPELIEEQWLIKPGNVKQLAEFIIKILDSPKLMAETIYKNYEKSHEYTNQFLSPRRSDFWKNYYNFVLTRKRRHYRK